MRKLIMALCLVYYSNIQTIKVPNFIVNNPNKTSIITAIACGAYVALMSYLLFIDHRTDQEIIDDIYKRLTLPSDITNNINLLHLSKEGSLVANIMNSDRFSAKPFKNYKKILEKTLNSIEEASKVAKKHRSAPYPWNKEYQEIEAVTTEIIPQLKQLIKFVDAYITYIDKDQILKNIQETIEGISNRYNFSTSLREQVLRQSYIQYPFVRYQEGLLTSLHELNRQRRLIIECIKHIRDDINTTFLQTYCRALISNLNTLLQMCQQLNSFIERQTAYLNQLNNEILSCYEYRQEKLFIRQMEAQRQLLSQYNQPLYQYNL